MLRLWINNEEAELKPDETIATTLQVNDVEKPDTFQSSFTNTFDLPLTRVNRRILGNAQAIGDNSTRRSQLPCRFEDSGIPIVTNGFLVINEITDRAFKVTVFDGVAEFFLQMGDTPLIELNLTSLIFSKTLTEVTNNTQNTWADGYVFALGNYGDLTTTTVDIRYQYPSLFVKYLFQEITSQFTDYTINNDGLYTDPFFESLLVPFHNFKGAVTQFGSNFLNTISSFVYTSDVTDEAFTGYNYDLYNNGVLNISTGIADLTVNQSYNNYLFTFNGDLTKSGIDPVTITLKIVGVTTGTEYATTTVNETTGGTKNIILATGFVLIKEPIKATVSITFAIPALEQLDMNLVSFGSVFIQDIQLSGIFPLQIGLPELTCKEFIKAIMKTFGIVPDVDLYRKTISFRKFQDFSTDTDLIDYSSNVDTSQDVIREDQYGGYAMMNNFVWADDEMDNPLFANGFFDVDNGLLSEDYNWIKLEFAATESKLIDTDEFTVCQLIVLDDSLELETQLKPRLGYIKYFTGSPIPSVDFTDGTSTNTDVDFSLFQFSTSGDSQTLNYTSLRDNYFLSFIAMIKKMEKLTIFLDLNAKEFRQVDFFKPVYLRFSYRETQVAGKYLWRKIEDYQGGRIAKCEFTKLN